MREDSYLIEMSVGLSWYEVPRPPYHSYSVASFPTYITDMYDKIKTTINSYS